MVSPQVRQILHTIGWGTRDHNTCKSHCSIRAGRLDLINQSLGAHVGWAREDKGSHSMLKILEQWYCDYCGGVIEGVSSGCVEWQSTLATGAVSGLRIVHKRRECTYDPAELALVGKKGTLIGMDMVMGAAGLGTLMGRLSEVLRSNSIPIEDLQAFIEVVRRTQVPYYEEARLAWRTGIDEGVHDGMEFDESTLRRIIHWKDAAIAAWVAAVTGRDVVPRIHRSVDTMASTSAPGSARVLDNSRAFQVLDPQATASSEDSSR